MAADVPAVLSLEELRQLAESDHTDGPWHAYFGTHGDPRVVTDPERPAFSLVAQVSEAPDDYGRADAELIAVAPALLASAIHYAQEASGLAKIGRDASAEVERLWPDETIHQAGLALAEEVGEDGRAITKRGHAQRNGTCKGMYPNEWTDNLRTELAQVVMVAARIAWSEGFDLAAACSQEIDALRSRVDA